MLPEIRGYPHGLPNLTPEIYMSPIASLSPNPMLSGRMNEAIPRRAVCSVESHNRPEVRRRLLEPYRAPPLRTPLPVRAAEHRRNCVPLNARRGPIPVPYDRGMAPHFVSPMYGNPIKNAGYGMIDRAACYRVLPRWWG